MKNRHPLGRIALCISLLSLGALARAQEVPNPPIKPTDAKGVPLNFDFETGTLKDWTATGDAFDKQPVHGDTVRPRRSTDKSAHQGEFWIGGYELAGDDATGTLTSVPFPVTHRFASFLIGGGHWPETRVELLVAGETKPFVTAHGTDREQLRPVVVDLEKQQGKQIVIRLVDEKKGGWGHINFDDFEFYDRRPTFKNELPSGDVADLPKGDEYKFAGVAPEKAAEIMTLPAGFKAQLVAGEPDIVQPIAFTIDARGRLWVVEGMTYPKRAKDGEGKDRVLVFEDETGAGHFTKRTVFAEGLNLVSGIEVGVGGVWIGAAPYLMFIPADVNADAPKPTGEPQILLDGFGYGDTHETLNTFCWGPDGWLYGCHGVFTHSDVGKPGTPKEQRQHLNCGIFRYHPTRHIFERFCEGTSNPWGVDFDDKGQIFIEACVIPHLWHMIQGAHYQRQGGHHDNPYVYDDIKTIADHVHYAGSRGPHAGNGRSDAMGGGHAHAGLMCYLGGSWPQEFVGQLFMNNIHGARINMDIPQAAGSGFVGHHGKDFILFNDLWSQIINLRYDRDGSVFMIDWYDKNQCHSNNPAVHDRSNGRIFKIVYGDTKTTHVDMSKLTDAELVDEQLSKFEWRVRTARRLLQERAAAKTLSKDAVEKLAALMDGQLDESKRLRVLWTLHCVSSKQIRLYEKLLSSDQPYVVGWAIQLLCEKEAPTDDVLQKFASLAATSKSAVVRLYLTSALQRLPEDKRWDILKALVAHQEDAEDHNLPLMHWYALEPLCAADAPRALGLAAESKMPGMLAMAVRRVGATGDNATTPLVALLEKFDDVGRQQQVLSGIRDSLQGRRSVPMPPGWNNVSAKLMASNDAEVRIATRGLGVTFGDEMAIAQSKAILVDSKASAGDRLSAMDSLLGIRDSELPSTLQQMLDDPNVRGAALRGLAAYDDPNTPTSVLTAYPALSPSEKKDALATLASRQSFARELLGAIESKQIPAKDVSADIIRQLRSLHDKSMDERVAKVWGVLRDSPADKKKRIAQLKALVEATGKEPDLSHGRQLFAKTCMQCHTLYDVGGHVGPDLTGSNRSDIDYLLENVVDPNAVIPADYRTTQIETNDNQTLLGIVRREDARSVTLVMPNQDLTIPKAEIKSQRISPLSMMPEGILDAMNDVEIRDLVAYLRAKRQVPLPPDAPK